MRFPVRSTTFALIVAPLALSACATHYPSEGAEAPPPEPLAGAEADYHQQQPLSVPPAIEELVEQYEAAVRALNAEAVASLYAEDGTHITGGGEAVQGPAALQAHYERNFPLFELLDLDIEFEELESTEDWAFGRTLVTREGKMKNGRAGADVALSAVVLKRVDGVWKIHWDMVGPGVGERPPEER